MQRYPRSLAMLIIVLLILTCIPLSTFAVNRTDIVSAAASTLESWTKSIGIYDTALRDPEENLSTIRINFKTTELDSLYQQTGDTVDFFIKSSRDTETGWIDLDGNGDYNKSSETLNSLEMASRDGLYIKDARLTRGNSVSFHIGSALPGKFTIQVFTAPGARPEKRIGEPITVEVKGGEGEVTLQAFNEEGSATLPGHTGQTSDPYELEAGTGIELRAFVKDGGYALTDRTVTFKDSVDSGSYKDIGTATTDEDGMAYLMYYGEKAGRHSFQAAVTEDDSPELYIDFYASEPYDVIAKTTGGKVVALGEKFDVEFSVLDRYGNIVGAENKNVEFIIDGPPGSYYEDYPLLLASTSAEGIATFTIEPDRSGEYSVKCSSIVGRGTDRVNFKAAPFGKSVEMQFEVITNNSTVPAVRYTDFNSDGIPEIAGTLQVKLVNSLGAEVLATGTMLQTLSFNTSNAAEVTVNRQGQITVLRKDFIGQVTLTVLDLDSNTTGTFNLQVSGMPAYLKHTSNISGKKAEVALQYVDKNGNVTYAQEGEGYNISLADKGISVSNVKAFDGSGKASFTLIGEEYKAYPVTVATKTYNVATTFDVKYTEGSAIPVTGAKNVIMFIGYKNYSQDGIAKVADVAPFINNGRTFVAVRPLGEAFGATIAWEPLSQTVTLFRSDLTIKIVIGSNKIIKTANGVSSTVQADVPAFITTEGRTVLPFRAVGDAFGVTVSYDASTNAVSYLQ